MADLTISDIGSPTAIATTLVYAADFRAATKVWPDLELPGDANTAVTDATIDIAGAAAARLVERYCRDEFTGDTTATSTVILDGNGLRSLDVPKRIQAGSVTAVEIRDDAGTYTTVDASDYRVRTSLDSAGTGPFQDGCDVIEYIDSSTTWTAGVLNVRITAKFGWATAPWAIKRACALLVYDWLAGRNAGMHRAERWQTPNMSFERANDVVMGMPEVRDLLDAYRLDTIAVI